MDKKHRELISQLNILCGTTDSKSQAASSGGSHQMTLTPPPRSEEETQTDLYSITTEYQLTARLRIELTRKQISILLGILNYQSVRFGVNFGMYLAMEHLSSLLIGQKSDYLGIKDEKERLTTGVSIIILQSLGGKDLTVWDRTEIPQAISQKIIEAELIMEKRVYGSRYSKWIPENFIQIKAVPLNTQFERVKDQSERYSSYCKGYGESHPSAHYKKTKPNSELDGETEDREYLGLRDIANLLILTQLEMRAKYLRANRKS